MSMVQVPRAELLAWAAEWQAENDPGDGTDCVTPFDNYLYGPSGEEVLRAELLHYVAKTGDFYISGGEAVGQKWIAVTRRELEGDPVPTPSYSITEVELRHMVAKLAAHVRPTCGELWAEAERLLNSTTPPSVPVGAAEDMVLDAIERRESSAPVGVEAKDAEIEALRAEVAAVWNAMPSGTRYLDPPDGGDVPLHEQVRRMAADAARAERLAEALRPLAALDLTPDDFDQRPDSQPIYARNRTVITVGDVRKARAALHPTAAQEATE